MVVSQRSTRYMLMKNVSFAANQLIQQHNNTPTPTTIVNYTRHNSTTMLLFFSIILSVDFIYLMSVNLFMELDLNGD